MISNFPHLISKTFSIEIIPPSNGGIKATNPSDKMVIRIIDNYLIEKQKHHFYYGSQDAIDRELKGKYMDILLWEKNINANKIKLLIMFKSLSHDMFIELFVISESDKVKELKLLKDLNLAKNLLRQRIDLFNPEKLHLSINSLNNNINNSNMIFSGDSVVASCRAYDGFPINNKPIITIPDQSNTRTMYDEDNFESKIYFHASIKHHLQKLICKAGNTVQSIIIYILHESTSIFIDPKIEKLVEPNTRLTCFVKDGYPPPKITWRLINGPKNASMYYKIISNGSQLYIKSNSPVKSSWTFKCSAKGNSEITARLISFNIAVQPSRLYVEPEIFKQIYSNLTISCFIKEDNLNAKIKWELVEGPTNASFYYNILKNGSEIYMNTNNLPGTMWTFKCNAKIVITTTKIMIQSISFVIAKNFMRCDEKCIHKKIFELEESVEKKNKLYQFLNELSKTVGKFKNKLNAKTESENPIPVLLSLNKPTKQSSDFVGHQNPLFSKFAVDGDLCQNVHAGHCSHTNYDFDNFWMVDLEEYYVINEVVIYNRVDCCQERIVGATVEVLSNSDEIIGDCGTITEPRNKYFIKCYSMIGQKIRIKLDKADYLTLCEVEVFGWL